MTGDPIERALPRILGPAAPETTCDTCFEQLDTYIDRELACGDAERAMPELAAHLQGCPACAEDAASLLALARGDARS